jgi:hypothetical protein
MAPALVVKFPSNRINLSPIGKRFVPFTDLFIVNSVVVPFAKYVWSNSDLSQVLMTYQGDRITLNL